MENEWGYKKKGQYPIDGERVLDIAPYWSSVLRLSAKKKNKKLYFVDVVIVVGFIAGIFACVEKYFL